MNPLPDGTLADVAGRAGISPEMISAGVVLIAPYLVSPLAAVWKRWRKTSGPDTRAVIKVLTALIVGAGGFALGLYGYDVRGLINAVGAALLAYLKTTGDYERDVNVQAKAARVSQMGTSTGDTLPPESPASAGDVEAEMMRQTRLDWPAVPLGDHR